MKIARALCGMALACSCWTASHAADTYTNPEQIQKLLVFQIAGYGKQFFKVDMADVVFSVSARHKDFRTAKTAHDEAIGKIKQFLAESEHKDDHFELKSTRLYRDDNRNPGLEDDYYVCASVYFVRTSLLSDLAGFQAALVERGADEILGNTLFSSKQRGLEDEARKLAIGDARKKAQLTAEELGWTLGKIVRIDYGETRPFYSQNHDGRAGYGSRGGREGGTSAENLAGEDYVESSATLTFEYSIK